jgi:hypothetical protein
MLRRPILAIGAISLVALLVSCSSGTDPVAPLAPAPEQTGDGFLTIRTVSVVHWNADRFQVTATVENRTDRAFYARLADPYGRPLPPALPTLYAAAGSSARLEQWAPPAWQGVQEYVLIEGVWVLELLPHTTYTMQGGSYRAGSDSRTVGTPNPIHPRLTAQYSLRFRVEYFDDAALSPDKAHQDFSNVFVVTRPRTP